MWFQMPSNVRVAISENMICSGPPEVEFPLVCKARGDLIEGDVVFHKDRFFKVKRLMVHAGHGAVIYAEGVWKDGTKAEWSFGDSPGACCYCVDRAA